MLGSKMRTLLSVVENESFTQAAQALSMTQPAVSHHIKQLEDEIGAPLFLRRKNGLLLTPQGEIAVKYARRLVALDARMHRELEDLRRNLTSLRVGITHTAESNLTAAVLAKCSNRHAGLSITIVTETIQKLYEMLGNYELDLAIVEGGRTDPELSYMMLDTDYLICVMANENPLARQAAVTLPQLKREQMILRLPSSATRALFESTLESIGESIESFDVILEVDNIATIKDLVRKDLGVSILARSACIDELGKGKLTALPIENLNMVRETRIVYHQDFSHLELLQEITRLYHQEVLRPAGSGR